jgi:phage shock protein A
LTSIDDEVHGLLAQHARALGELVQPQVELAERLRRAIEDRRRRGAPLEDDETRAIEAELDRLAAETASRRQELERAAETLEGELQPARLRLLSLEDELRTEIERWRERNAALLQRLEESATPLDIRPPEDGSLR